jgi:glutamate-ammonia-ligase adenylyltransferase
MSEWAPAEPSRSPAGHACSRCSRDGATCSYGAGSSGVGPLRARAPEKGRTDKEGIGLFRLGSSLQAAKRTGDLLWPIPKNWDLEGGATPRIGSTDMDAEQVKRLRIEGLSGISRTLPQLVETDAELGHLLGAAETLPDREAYLASLRAASAGEGPVGIRKAKRRLLAQIAAFDAVGDCSFEEAMAALADLAGSCLQVVLEDLDARGLAVIGMGKLGGRELNYFSDIDVMFVADSDITTATKSAETVLRTLGEHSPEGRAYEIDTALRPEGRAGALVRSLEGYLEYYRRWAQPWEYQALIKAQPVAGDVELGHAFVKQTRDFVFPESITGELVASVRDMKRRVEDHAAVSARRSKASSTDDVKLGPGGIRDVEFSVQLLQLVHGGADADVRSASTIEALRALVNGGYVAEEDGAGLEVAYRWLRIVEHRLQLWQERRVHRIPTDEEGRAALARALGFKDSPAAGAFARFEERHNAVLGDVRGRFEKIFYRPMVESLADAGATRLSPDALRDRLFVLGFRDAERATRTLTGLVSGTSRRAKLFRVLTPALLRFLAESPLPDEGLFSFLRLGEALSGRVDTLGTLRDNPPGLEFLAKVLGSGRLLGEVLSHVPEEVQTIADPRGPGDPKSRERLVREAVASLEWRDPARRLDGLRRFKRREMLRVALADLAGTADVSVVGTGLANLADACLDAALGEAPLPFAVMGMGKLGGRELNYSSDIDVMFVFDGDPHLAEKVAEDLMQAIGSVTPEGQAFLIDAALRPEGKSGPLARSLRSFAEYYEKWARPWEYMAATKARVCAGDQAVGLALEELLEARAYPAELPTQALAEIRHLKARMERERIPRGTDPRRHLKMGPGGLSDVEFAVQILQLQHGYRIERLRTTNTLEALDGARALGLMSDEDAGRLRETYEFLMRLRNRLFFFAGRPTDALPVRPEDLEALGVAMGFGNQPRQELEEHYLRLTRRARRVAEPLIYD